MMIRYQFKSEEYKKKGILKPELKSIAMRLFVEYLDKEGEHANEDSSR